MQNYAILQRFQLLELLIVADNNVHFAQLIAQGIGNLFVQKRQKSFASIDQVHQHAKPGEN